MLNRVKNGEQEQRVYLEILNDIIHNKDIEEEIRRLTQDFLS